MNFKDLLQTSFYSWGHTVSHNLDSYNALEPSKPACHISSNCCTHHSGPSSSPYWNNLLSTILPPVLLLPQNTNWVFIIDSLSFHNVKFFSSFLHNIVPMLRNYCIGFASKYMYINIHLYVTLPLIMLLFFIILAPSFLYKLFEGMIGHDFCISCHSLKNLASILHSDYSIKNIKYSNDITIPDLEI